MNAFVRMYASLALALIVALSGITHAQARHSAHSAQTMVICTGYGLVRITLDAEGNPVEQTLPCPDCVLSSAALLPEGMALPTLRSGLQTLYPHMQSLWQGGSAGFWSESRSPPHLI